MCWSITEYYNRIALTQLACDSIYFVFYFACINGTVETTWPNLSAVCLSLCKSPRRSNNTSKFADGYTRNVNDHKNLAAWASS